MLAMFPPECFTITGFFTLHEVLHPLFRPFVLVYSIAQDLVSRQYLRPIVDSLPKKCTSHFHDFDPLIGMWGISTPLQNLLLLQVLPTL